MQYTCTYTLYMYKITIILSLILGCYTVVDHKSTCTCICSICTLCLKYIQTIKYLSLLCSVLVYCNVLVHCRVLQCFTISTILHQSVYVLYCSCTLQCTALLYYIYCTALVCICTVLYCTVLYCTVLYCSLYTVVYCSALIYLLYCISMYMYCTVLYCTVLYCTCTLYKGNFM